MLFVACSSPVTTPEMASPADAAVSPVTDATTPIDLLAMADLNVANDLATSSACGPLTGTWSRCAINPVARAGFQEVDGRYEISIGDPDVQFDAQASLWRAWWSTGLTPKYSIEPQLAIKYAQSVDGVTWAVQPAPAISASTNPADWDSSKLETPTVLHLPNNPAGTRYLLFYSGADANQKTVNGSQIPWYQIGLATSDDGKSFTRLDAAKSPYGKAGLVLLGKDAFPFVPNVADGLVADPEIVFDGTLLHLFYSSLAVDKNGAPLAFGVSHSTSTDAIHWTAVGINPIAILNGSKGPSLVQTAAGTWEMFFQRDTAQDLAMVPSVFNPQLGIWRSTSADLKNWTATAPTRELTWDGTLASEKYGWIAVGDMTLVNGEYRYYEPAFSSLAPPMQDWVVPTSTGYLPSLIVMDLQRRR